MNSILAIKTKITQATTHRGNARLWLQNAPEMLQAGFVPNATYSTDYLPSGIVLRLASDESKLRKVSATARGATLDINNSKLRAYDFSHGIRWIFLDGQINIEPINKGA